VAMLQPSGGNSGPVSILSVWDKTSPVQNRPGMISLAGREDRVRRLPQR
jgi:hypothetical protein